MYRIFINDRLLILMSSKSNFKHNEVSEIVQYESRLSISSAINKLSNGICNDLIVKGDDVNIMWQDFCSRYVVIEAAGGIVLSSDNKVLWIRRNGRWDLPKGKVEPGEKYEDTAVREVEEECGVYGIHRGSLLSLTYHTYLYKGEEVLKKSYWYAMSCRDNQELKPQLEEGITKVIWADQSMHFECMQDTYSSITELLKQERVQHFLDF